MEIFITLFISHIIVLLIGYSLSPTSNIENNYYYDCYDPDFGEESDSTDDSITPTASES